MKVYNVLEEVKSTGISSISSIRYWLIRKLAGKRMIVLNAIIYISEDENSLAKFSEDGGIVAENVFPSEKGITLQSRFE